MMEIEEHKEVKAQGIFRHRMELHLYRDGNTYIIFFYRQCVASLIKI